MDNQCIQVALDLARALNRHSNRKGVTATVTLSYESRHINRGIGSWKEANTAEEAEEAEQPLKSHSIDYKYRLSRPSNSWTIKHYSDSEFLLQL